jgi:hypothetical protein
MRVFISWSGEPSRSIAEALADWLQDVLPDVNTWMSVRDINSGDRWSEEVAQALDATDYGIVCITRGNQDAPWLIFESGALAKSVAKGKVVPLCIDLDMTDMKGPLATFQGRSLDKPGMLRLVQDLNKSAGRKIPRNEVEVNFDSSWAHLKAAIEKAKSVARTDRISGGQSAASAASDPLLPTAKTPASADREQQLSPSVDRIQQYLGLSAEGETVRPEESSKPVG